MFRCVFSGEERRGEMYVRVCVFRGCISISLAVWELAPPLVSGILSMYGIFLLSFLIRPGDWELIMA